jgi:hypothetical protein
MNLCRRSKNCSMLAGSRFGGCGPSYGLAENWRCGASARVLPRDDYQNSARVHLTGQRFRTREVYHQPESGLRPARRHGRRGRSPRRSIAPSTAEWLFSPTCFGCGRERSSGRSSGAAGTVLRRQDKRGSPFGRFAVVISELRRAAGNGMVPLSRKSQWNQCELRHP